jgi:hypothetical protein
MRRRAAAHGLKLDLPDEIQPIPKPGDVSKDGVAIISQQLMVRIGFDFTSPEWIFENAARSFIATREQLTG